MKPSVRFVCVCCAVFILLAAQGCGPSKSPSRGNVREKTKAARSSDKPAVSAKPKESTGERVDLHKLFGQSPQPQPQLPWQQTAPQVLGFGQSGATPKDQRVPTKTSNAKPTPQQLLAAVQHVYRGAKSLKVDYTSDLLVKLDGKIARRANGMSGTIMFKRPDKFVIKDEEVQLISDGKTFYNYVVPAKQFRKLPMSKDILREIVLGRPGIGVLGLLFGVNYAPAISSMKLLPDSKIGGRETYVLQLQLKVPKGMNATQTLWIGKQDLSIYKNRLTSEVRPVVPKDAKGRVPKVVWTQVSNTAVKVMPNAKLSDSMFAFKPPAGARLVELPKKVNLVGKSAPDFSFKWVDGSAIKLSAFRGKGVVLCFWALPQAKDHLPVLQRMHERYGENVRLVAINLNAEAGKVKNYLKQKGFSFPVVQADESIVETAVRSYGLVALPTVFLIDENGIVRDCIVGDIDRQLTDERLSKIMPKNSSNS